jgi:hypothetical protein
MVLKPEDSSSGRLRKEALAGKHGTWITPIDDPYLPIQYATVNLIKYLQKGDGAWVSVSCAQTAETDDFLRVGPAIGEAIRNSNRKVVLCVVHKYKLPAMETADCVMAHDATDGTPDGLAEALKELAADRAPVWRSGELLVANHIGIKEAELERTATLQGDALRDYYIHYV